MSETRKQNSPMMSPSDGVESDDMTITVEEKKLVRKLIQVLVKMVPGDDIEVPPSPRGQRPRDHETAVVAELGENIRHFKNLCENHNQLTNQIRSALNALGGGSRAAKALQAMDDKFKAASDAIYVRDKYVYIYLERCVRRLNEACVAVTEVIDPFKELGVFNTTFFNSFRWQVEDTTNRIGLEYGLVDLCAVDEYVDFLWGPLASDFDKFIKELATVAEKEIASIRQTQEFTSQRYLNLTTVATFLSSVTATTLQISANNPVSVLTAVTNTLWFISLVFSAASAVYSLLLMTWRQSSVRRPDLSLPFLANAWLRNAPMYSLIAALSTFSIGLCLLAFLVVEQQGGPASAAIPTAFAGFHANVIFLLSGWFLFEQWRNKHEEQWVKVKDTYLLSVVLSGRGVANRINKTARGLRRFSSVTKKLWLELVGTLNRNDESDIEPGQSAPPATVTDEYEKPSSGEAREVADTTKSSKPEDELATFETVASPGNELNRMVADVVPEKQDEYGPMRELLQFSSDGKYLVSSISDCVTIYNVHHSVDIKSTRKVPGVGIVKQIALNRMNDLLLVTTKQVFVWNLDRLEDYDVRPLFSFDEVVIRVRWVDEDDDTRSFVCAVGGWLIIFDESCKELHSHDISKMHRIERILDIGLFRKKYIFVLVTLPEGGTEILVFNRETKSIEETFEADRELTSIVSTPMSDVVLVYGSTVADTFVFKSAVEGELSTRSSRPFVLEDKLVCGVLYTETVTLYGKGYMSIGHLPGQIKCLSVLYDDQCHLFTTPDTDAVVNNPVGFAVAPAGVADPYLFAILDKDGSVKLWSVQSNTKLAWSDEARDFEVHDRRGLDGSVTVTNGRYLVLPPPEVIEHADA